MSKIGSWQNLTTKVGNHRSFLTFIISAYRDDVWSWSGQRTRDRFKILPNSSALVLFWRRSNRMHCKSRWPPCTKDHHQATARWTQTKNKNSILLRIVLVSLHKDFTEIELETELLQCQSKDTEVTERTTELLSKQGNTDIAELAVISETTQSETCKDTTQKEGPSASVESSCKNYRQKRHNCWNSKTV